MSYIVVMYTVQRTVDIFRGRLDPTEEVDTGRSSETLSATEKDLNSVQQTLEAEMVRTDLGQVQRHQDASEGPTTMTTRLC